MQIKVGIINKFLLTLEFFPLLFWLFFALGTAVTGSTTSYFILITLAIVSMVSILTIMVKMVFNKNIDKMYIYYAHLGVPVTFIGFISLLLNDDLNNYSTTPPISMLSAGIVVFIPYLHIMFLYFLNTPPSKKKSPFFKNLRRKFLPTLSLQSEIKDVVYLNFLVDIEAINYNLPKGVSLINIQGKTLFTILTYQHGHFRPQLFRGFKAPFLSPLQSNWRFYVDGYEGKKVESTILFVQNFLSSQIITTLSLIMSDAMNTRYTKPFRHEKLNNSYHTTLTQASTTLLHAQVSPASEHNIPSELLDFFGSEAALLEYLCHQDYAYNYTNDKKLCQSNISLDYDITKLQALHVDSFASEWIQQHLGSVTPFAFLMPEVTLKTVAEDIL